jgi:hypothetical protein
MPLAEVTRSLLRKGFICGTGKLRPDPETGRLYMGWTMTAAGRAACLPLGGAPESHRPELVAAYLAEMRLFVLAEYERRSNKGHDPVRQKDVVATITRRHRAPQAMVEEAISKLLADGLITGAGRVDH